jgi:outer membrane protein TolC
LVRSLAAFERDLLELDGALRPERLSAEAPFSLADPALQPPDPAAAPTRAAAADQPEERLLSLSQALAVAVANNPELAERRARIAEMRGLKRSVQGRFWPRLGLNLGGAFSQRSDYNLVLQDNAGIYPPIPAPGAAFLVEENGWNRIQANRGSAWGSLDLDWELINFERGAALAEQDQRLTASLEQYGDALRQLQLQVSEAYYGLQLADQLLRVRQAVVRNDALVRDQVAALKGSGLVPRLDLLRAVRANPATRDTPFILVTASLSEEAWRGAIELGATDFLVKPFTIDQLHASMDICLNLAKGAAPRSNVVAFPSHRRAG